MNLIFMKVLYGTIIKCGQKKMDITVLQIKWHARKESGYENLFFFFFLLLNFESLRQQGQYHFPYGGQSILRQSKWNHFIVHSS